MAGDTHLGEAGLLARMLPHLADGEQIEVGPGDDAAVVRLPSARLVVTTDTLVEGHDFLPRTTAARWIGHKAAVQNLADVAAMGARPVALVAALSAPASTPASTFEQLTIGLAHRAEADGARVVGGDLGRAPQLTVTVTAVGALEEGRPAVLRSGARPGDILAIGADRLGRSAAGLGLVLSGRAPVDGCGPARPGARCEQSGDRGAGELVAWHSAPYAERRRGWTAGGSGHARRDLSDGLVREGGRMAAASQVAVDLEEQ